jgi:GntP family gluconate:H+ symporter
MGVWVLLGIAVATVLTAILWLRLHPFLALMLAGLVVAAGTSEQELRGHAEVLVRQGKLEQTEVDPYVSRGPAARLATAFGATAGNVGILIALAGVIGSCLMASGAAMSIVDFALRIVGEKRAAIALASSSFLLGIPVFFDTVFYLMVPLARSLRKRTGSHYVLYILAIMAGGSIAHSLVPPTPGPLQVAEILDVDILTLMVAGLVVGGLSSIFSLAAAWGIDRFVDVPLRPLEGSSDEPIADPNRSGPPVSISLIPIALPILLIAGQTITDMWVESRGSAGKSLSPLADSLISTISLLGNRNVALAIGAAIAIGLLRWAPRTTDRRRIISDALASAGVIILITAAGGAFGAMLGESGLAERMAGIGTAIPGLLVLPLAFGTTTAIRTVQGSATVAMITAAGILQGFATADALPFHPVYLALAIGGGSKPISWMTDSGFWIMCKMSGMTESEGLKTVSPLTIAMGLSTLFWTMIAAYLFPLK